MLLLFCLGAVWAAEPVRDTLKVPLRGAEFRLPFSLWNGSAIVRLDRITTIDSLVRSLDRSITDRDSLVAALERQDSLHQETENALRKESEVEKARSANYQQSYQTLLAEVANSAKRFDACKTEADRMVEEQKQKDRRYAIWGSIGGALVGALVVLGVVAIVQ